MTERRLKIFLDTGCVGELQDIDGIWRAVRRARTTAAPS